MVAQEIAALLTSFISHLLGCNVNQTILVELDSIEGVVRQCKAILVHQFCVSMLTCKTTQNINSTCVKHTEKSMLNDTSFIYVSSNRGGIAW